MRLIFFPLSTSNNLYASLISIRLSARLQRADRIISNPAYSPPLITRRPFSLGDSPTTTTSPSASTSPSTSLSTSVNSNNSYQGEKDYNKQKQRLSASSLTSARTSSGAYSNSGITASAQGPRLRRSTTLIGEMSSIHSGLMNGKSIGGRKKRSSTVTVPCSAPSSSESPLTGTILFFLTHISTFTYFLSQLLLRLAVKVLVLVSAVHRSQKVFTNKDLEFGVQRASRLMVLT